MSDALEALKPCPFCPDGGDPQMRTWDFPYVRYQVRCSKCKATTRSRLKSWLEAEEAWNTRAALEQKAEPVAVVDMVTHMGDGRYHTSIVGDTKLEVGTHLYTAPPSTAEAQARALDECKAFLGGDFGGHQGGHDHKQIVVLTLEGQHIASEGDYLIRGVKGEHYPCKPDIFQETYEPSASEPTPINAAATPQTLLEAAKKWDGGPVDVVVIAIDRDGDVISGSTMDSTGDILMALTIVSRHMVDVCDEMGFRATPERA